jgi:hypothetical protein
MMWKCMYCKQWHKDNQSCPDIKWDGCLLPALDHDCDRSITMDGLVTAQQQINTQQQTD